MWTSNKLRKKNSYREMHWISGCVHAFTKPIRLFSASLLLFSCPEQNDPSVFALVRRLEGTKHKFPGWLEINEKNHDTPVLLNRNPTGAPVQQERKVKQIIIDQQNEGTVTGRGKIKAVQLPTRQRNSLPTRPTRQRNRLYEILQDYTHYTQLYRL